MRMWEPEPGTTQRLASRSLWKTSSPLSGHLTQRLSGDSRLRIDRIFGGTTLDIQFMSGPLCALLPARGERELDSYSTATLRAERTPSLRSRTSEATASTVFAVARLSLSSECFSASTIAVPTTTPSA